MPPKKKVTGSSEPVEKEQRIAIVNADKCKPKKCNQECKRSCPVVRMGRLCIEVTPSSKIAFVSEQLCIGCGIVRLCLLAELPSARPPPDPPYADRCTCPSPLTSVPKSARSRPSPSSSCPPT